MLRAPSANGFFDLKQASSNRQPGRQSRPATGLAAHVELPAAERARVVNGARAWVARSACEGCPGIAPSVTCGTRRPVDRRRGTPSRSRPTPPAAPSPSPTTAISRMPTPCAPTWSARAPSSSRTRIPRSSCTCWRGRRPARSSSSCRTRWRRSPGPIR